MSVEIKPITLLASTYIAANFREADKQEFAASSPAMTVEQFGFMAPFLGPHSYVAYLDNNPVFMFGVSQTEFSPQLGVAWGFGTNDTHKIILQVSRFVRRKLIPDLLKAGVQRVEVRVIESHHTSIAWMTKRLGANFETLLPNMGANGETFLLLSWTKDKLANVWKHFRPPQTTGQRTGTNPADSLNSSVSGHGIEHNGSSED